MTLSYSYTRSSTFTIANARHVSSKIAADMHICALYYGEPSESRIRDYAEELAQLLNEGYVKEYEFGYKKDGKRVVCWRYTVNPDGTITTDDRPGKLPSSANISGCSYYNFLTKSSAWWALAESERERFEANLPVQRTVGSLPEDGNGYWASDKSYSSGGLGLGRQTYRPFA